MFAIGLEKRPQPSFSGLFGNKWGRWKRRQPAKICLALGSPTGKPRCPTGKPRRCPTGKPRRCPTGLRREGRPISAENALSLFLSEAICRSGTSNRYRELIVGSLRRDATTRKSGIHLYWRFPAVLTGCGRRRWLRCSRAHASKNARAVMKSHGNMSMTFLETSIVIDGYD